MSLALIDYGTGNIRSVARAFERLGATVNVASSPDQALKQEPQALVFPGQGCFHTCMADLRSTGFDRLVKEWIAADKPFFGICLGLQVLFEHSEEGDVPGLGILPGRVTRFRLPSEYKIPHMGWNAARFSPHAPEFLRKGLSDGDQFYFVHSYHVRPDNPDVTLCQADYGSPFTAGISFGNCHATQFHPEKSQAKGLQLYRNFLEGTGLA